MSAWVIFAMRGRAATLLFCLELPKVPAGSEVPTAAFVARFGHVRFTLIIGMFVLSTGVPLGSVLFLAQPIRHRASALTVPQPDRLH
jgi:hypothetical protein